MLDRLTSVTGLAPGDIAILIGALSFLSGLLMLGVSGNKGGRRWLFWLGWLIMIGGLALLVIGARHHSGAPG